MNRRLTLAMATLLTLVLALACGRKGEPLSAAKDAYGHRVFTEHKTEVNGISIKAIAFSQDGRYLASMDNSGVLVLRDLLLNKFRRWQAHATEGNALAFSPSGRVLASAGRGKGSDADDVALWNVTNGSKVDRLKTATSYNALQFQNERQFLACGWLTGVDVWNLDARRILTTHKLREGEGHLRGLSLGSDGTITVQGERRLWIWPADGAPCDVSRRESPAPFLARSRFGQILALGGCQGALDLWSYQPDGTWVPESTLLPYSNNPNRSFSSSPMGVLPVASQDLGWVLHREDGDVWSLWIDLQNPPLIIPTHNMRETAVALDVKGKRFAYGNAEPTVYLITLP